MKAKDVHLHQFRGQTAPSYPDFVVFRREGGHIVGHAFVRKTSHELARPWACAIVSPNPTVRRPTAKPNALSVLPCANGLTASSIIIQIREPPCLIAGCITTTGIDRIMVSAVCRLLPDFRGMRITCCNSTVRYRVIPRNFELLPVLQPTRIIRVTTTGGFDD